ncbi:MAG: glutamate--tRNA ligase [Candidatus Aenigmarchaeota archaeon]|nr:glutamate--tRNA ligase [Candidatus Aenigmarchaeota archaeon]
MNEIILKHVLLNAIRYEGKSNLKAVVGKLLAENPELKNNIVQVMKETSEIIKEVNSWGLEKQMQKLEKMGIKIEKKVREEVRELPPLKNVGEQVIMRMAPFPSGPLHIGNVRMAILNDEYVKKYKGKLLLVIDDTIGSKEKIPTSEAYEMIEDGLKWLGIDYHEVLKKSDRMELFYEYAEKLIKIDAVYVCECPAEVLRENRRKGVNCNCRNQSIEKNLEKWKKMLDGFYNEGEATLRLKTSMSDPNPAFRDRVLLRICNRTHPLVGDKYHVWPMLEYSWAIDDHVLEMTHILRGKDLVMEDMMEEFIWKLFKWKHPELLHYGMIGIEGIKLSKSQSRRAIESGEYSGWDDPRTWSIQSLRKRGFRPEAIRNFILSFGMSMNDITVPVDVLYNENRKIIEPIANRYFTVFDPVEISVGDCPQISQAEEPLHPDYPKRGKRTVPVNTRKIYISKEDYDKHQGKEVRLIGLFNVVLDKDAKFAGNEIVQEMPKIQWVSENNVSVSIVMNDGIVKKGIAEPEVSGLSVDDIIQFMRFGFVRLDDKKMMRFYYTHK